MADLAQELLEMKRKIEQSKAECQRIEGQVSQLEKQRLEEFGCSTDAEADEYIKELEGQIAVLESEVRDGVQAVREELNW